MKQTDFSGQRGAYHLECHHCHADLHLVRWDPDITADGPTHCPYCGSDEVWSADEARHARPH